MWGAPRTSWFVVAHDQIREAWGRNGPVLTGVGNFIIVRVTDVVLFEEAIYITFPCDTCRNYYLSATVVRRW